MKTTRRFKHKPMQKPFRRRDDLKGVSNTSNDARKAQRIFSHIRLQSKANSKSYLAKSAQKNLFQLDLYVNRIYGFYTSPLEKVPGRTLGLSSSMMSFLKLTMLDISQAKMSWKDHVCLWSRG